MAYDDSLEDLRDVINELGAGVNASIFNDGSSRPYRLSLSGSRMGAEGSVTLDASGLNLEFQQTAQARDAVVVCVGTTRVAVDVLVGGTGV